MEMIDLNNYFTAYDRYSMFQRHYLMENHLGGDENLSIDFFLKIRTQDDILTEVGLMALHEIELNTVSLSSHERDNYFLIIQRRLNLIYDVFEDDMNNRIAFKNILLHPSIPSIQNLIRYLPNTIDSKNIVALLPLTETFPINETPQLPPVIEILHSKELTIKQLALIYIFLGLVQNRDLYREFIDKYNEKVTKDDIDSFSTLIYHFTKNGIEDYNIKIQSQVTYRLNDYIAIMPHIPLEKQEIVQKYIKNLPAKREKIKKTELAVKEKYEEEKAKEKAKTIAKNTFKDFWAKH